MIDDILKICGAISIVAGVIIIAYKCFRYLYPATCSISYTLSAVRENPDSIAVTITNRSNAPIYIQSCTVRCTYSAVYIAKLHMLNPFLHPRLYQNLRYNSCVYSFIKDEPVRLEPSQQTKLVKTIYEHPLNALYGPKLIAFVKLTTGRTVKSKRMPSPVAWQKIGSRGKVLAPQTHHPLI